MKEILSDIEKVIASLHQAGTYKSAPAIDGPMGPAVELADGREVVNLCSNNYLGLANHPEVNAGALGAIEKHGNGTASVRFICGSFTLHDELEREIADFLGMESATTYVSCWNANEALVRDQPTRALRTLRQALDIDPYRDDTNLHFLEALGRLGRRSEAIDHYQRYVRLLADELSLDPPEEIRDLYTRLIG